MHNDAYLNGIIHLLQSTFNGGVTMNIDINLKKLRSKKGLSIESFASVVNTTAEEVISWESGTSVPNMNQLLTISKFYGVETDSILFKDVSTDDSNAISKTDVHKKIDITSRVPNLYKRQKMLVKISGIYMFIVTSVIFIVFLFFLRLIMVKMSSEYLDVKGYDVVGLIIILLLCIGSFFIAKNLVRDSKCSDFDFIKKIDRLLIYGFLLLIPIVSGTAGWLLIISYFSTDSEKYYNSIK